MRVRFLFFVNFFYAALICAQPLPGVEQIKKESSGIRSASAAAKRGNVFSVSLESSTVVVNTGVTTYRAVHNNNIFVSKIDSGNGLIWKKRLRGINNFDYCEPSIVLDSVGDMYVAYNRLSASEDWNSFVVKLDSLGNILWTKCLGKPYNGGINIRSVTIDKRNEVCITGFFWGKVAFEAAKGDSIITAAQEPGVFVCKVDAAGNYKWIRGMERTAPACITIEPQQASLQKDELKATANNTH